MATNFAFTATDQSKRNLAPHVTADEMCDTYLRHLGITVGGGNPYEHGGLHGVSDHPHLVDQRKLASIRQPLHVIEEKERWRILVQKTNQIRGQDKSRAVGWGGEGWNYFDCGDVACADVTAALIKNSTIPTFLAPSLTLG